MDYDIWFASCDGAKDRIPVGQVKSRAIGGNYLMISSRTEAIHQL